MILNLMLITESCFLIGCVKFVKSVTSLLGGSCIFFMWNEMTFLYLLGPSKSPG